MRKLIYFTMASIDGFIERSDGNSDWVIVDEELHLYLNNRERDIGAYLYGRRMYELMMDFWPTADAQSNPAYVVEFAQIWKQIPKIVFSRTLERVEGNAVLVKEDVVTEVARLKEQPGKDLEVGGAKLARTLMESGLIDEYQIYIQPVILGSGTPMFPAMGQTVRLKLVETHNFSSGVVFLRYQCAD
ncbi:MAG: dihydrofolate reductase family protein [Chloroflexi bacterium]|nr:dihydrofolate reductase family protein [Chloroflexota bacterium]